MLTELAIKNARPRDKDYKLADAEGLHLYVTKTGHRSWRLKYRFAGKERRLILGAWPELSLRDARDRKAEARKLLREGRDPGIEAAKLRIERAVASANTFEALARGWFALQEGRWTPVHARDVISSLEKDVFPWVGKLPITEIDEPMVLSVLRKIEKRGAIETAHRIRQRMSAVFVHAIAEGVGSRDPAAIVTKALKPVPRSRKRPALVTLASLHNMLRKTECEPASPLTKLASRFLALTAQRPGMIRALPWAEIENVDWQDDGPAPDALWRVPAHRMKLTLDLKSDDGFEHLVPLSAQAVDVLRAAYVLTGRGPLVFPGNRNARTPMSENTLSYFYNRCSYQGRHVPHGWRASFSTIMNEWALGNGTPADRYVIDLILAHVPDGVSGSEGAYNRAAYLDRRRALLSMWASMLLDGFPAPAKMLGWPSR
ncbi:integrase arm-type DNA-binding domain-containing protein [uncultured Sphingorhabdus sp.]|uniref:tyrosine-type recombinase/integrase n=1 Tax=uncultured Sphingorhabdus sp. TaxID=1686106 RepID=UPI00262399B2|nr:integrase arm-type DNA-binding domain-containing protein [uncultured Sphingorhabdus sp.]HMS19481.1 integrase arm-type DNA-binding domain-containing protein [Sphingorhabdus sp.]